MWASVGKLPEALCTHTVLCCAERTKKKRNTHKQICSRDVLIFPHTWRTICTSCRQCTGMAQRRHTLINIGMTCAHAKCIQTYLWCGGGKKGERTKDVFEWEKVKVYGPKVAERWKSAWTDVIHPLLTEQSYLPTHCSYSIISASRISLETGICECSVRCTTHNSQCIHVFSSWIFYYVYHVIRIQTWCVFHTHTHTSVHLWCTPKTQSPRSRITCVRDENNKLKLKRLLQRMCGAFVCYMCVTSIRVHTVLSFQSHHSTYDSCTTYTNGRIEWGIKITISASKIHSHSEAPTLKGTRKFSIMYCRFYWWGRYTLCCC